MSIFLAPVADPSSYGIADVDATHRITRFVEKPPPGQAPTNLGNAGTWLFDPEVLDHIPDQKMDGSIERLVMPGLIAEGKLVQGFPSDAYWMDLGTPERYMQIHHDLLAGKLPAWLSPDALAGPVLGADSEVWHDATIAAPALLGRHCRVGGGARITGPSVLGDDCTVREHATIERSVLWNDVRIGANAVVRDSILGAGCWVGDDAVVVNAVLANGAKVQRGVKLTPGARLEPDEVAS
jgi:mannose-1-phosphate guanylyltransferase